MKKFYQTEWQDIKFESFSKLSQDEIADEDFYTKFYEIFFSRYFRYEDINASWLNNKEIDARFIIDQIQERERVLSIGCGLGYVEKLISELWGGELIALEPAKSGVNRWILDNKRIIFKNGYFPEAMNGEVVDFAYANAIDYVFDQNEFEGFLGCVANYPIREFVLISASLDANTLQSNIKYVLKNVLASLGIKKLGQFWGYQRTRDEYRNFILKSGFDDFKDGFLNNGQYWIKGIKK